MLCMQPEGLDWAVLLQVQQLGRLGVAANYAVQSLPAELVTDPARSRCAFVSSEAFVSVAVSSLRWFAHRIWRCMRYTAILYQKVT